MTNEKIISSYINQLTDCVLSKIDKDLKGETANALFKKHFTERIVNEKNNRSQFNNFQVYYFETLGEIDKIDFKDFKQRYSLQGVNSGYLEWLNNHKKEIGKFIETDNLSELYFKYFVSAKIKTKSGTKKKTLGSFFTKLVHTLKPEDYTPVDIPMKNYFGFEKDSYYIAMIVISKAFKDWCNKNRTLVEDFKEQMCKYVNKNYKIAIGKELVTDMKVMNTIYWSIANPVKDNNNRPA